MEKKSLIVALALLLMLPVFVEPTAALHTEKKIPNVDELRYASIGEPEASDPAWAYDTSSSKMIFNVYETLIFWPWERVPEDPHEFEPMLATEWVLPEDPEYPGVAPGAPPNTVETWYFTIRTKQRVPYHDEAYGTVTPADVEYSIERALVFDHIGGPTWMHYYPLLNLSGSLDWDTNGDGWISPDEAAVGGPLIDGAVESNATHVWFNLAISYPCFIQILAQTWSSVYPQAWGTDLYNEGRFVWPGWSYVGTTGNPYTAWIDFNDNNHPQLRVPFDNPYTVMMGTGPYKFDYWEKGDRYQLVRFGDYWKGWPDPSSASYVSVFIHMLKESWFDRRAMFLSNLAAKQVDIVDVPRAFIGQVEGEPGVRGVKNLPSLSDSPDMFFNYQVRADAIYFTIKPKLGADEKPDLFSDKHMRKAFAHALDYGKYLIDAFLGEAFQPASPIKRGLPEFNATKQKYTYDMAKVVDELKLAWAGAPGGSAWDQGFYVPLTYNSGNEERRIVCQMIEASIASLGAKYQVDVFSLPWADYLLPAIKRRELTVFFVGWQADFTDANNMIVPFMHSTVGTFAKQQSVSYTNFQPGDFAPNSGRVDSAGHYINWEGEVVSWADLNNTYVAELIDAAATGTPAQRLAMYSELEDIYYASCASVPLAQPLVRYWERDWVQGWYYNPILGGSLSLTSDPYALYVYRMWKGLDADTTGDGKVTVEDITPINMYYFEAIWIEIPGDGYWQFIYGPAGEYNRVADISSPFEDGGRPRTWELDGDEILWGHYSWDPANPYIPSSKPIAGYEIPGVDGYVDLYDMALISAQLYDYVTPY